ncbi:hypothetical protein CFC21_032386 [Triticum aestivum]|uniref:DUF4220 domain-containing protein n=2 Tax=Triticum aestivum TaxID=4565 RepID=A0A9R1EZZ3_WHEAT|nr:hypothetical protein CFC21_032386 [Triticum aestivum]
MWATVVLLGGFVSMIDKVDFGRLTLITLIELLWINASFLERIRSSADLLSSLKAAKNLLTRSWQLGDNARNHHQEPRGIKRDALALLVAARWALALVHSVVLSFCIASVMCLLLFGLLITTLISILGLIRDDHYGDTGEGRVNMDPAHNILYVLCLAQGALFMYRIALFLSRERIVKKVSRAYGFQDDGHAVSCYLDEIRKGYSKKISSARERNLITYAIELMESKSPRSCLSGALILDRLLTRKHPDEIKAPDLPKQHEPSDLSEMAGAPLVEKDMKNKKQRKKKREEIREKRGEWRKKRQQNQQTEEEIIVVQRRMIRRLIGSAASTHILQKLLHTLDSWRPFDKRMREAAARIVEHVASGIRLVQFPRGIQCISSLLNCFEEYCRLQPYRSSSSSSSLNTNGDTTRTPRSSKANNGHDQEQDSSIHTSTLESELEYSESESESESESDSESDSDRGIDRPKMLHGYKELVLIGLNILWSLAGSEDNCAIISKAKYPVS